MASEHGAKDRQRIMIWKMILITEKDYINTLALIQNVFHHISKLITN